MSSPTINIATIDSPIIKPREWDKRILFTVLLTLLGSMLLVGFVLVKNDFDPVVFANIGTEFSEGDPDGTKGYDGQFVYFIARYGADSIPYLDGPTLRFQRVVYPLTARVLVLGNGVLVAWSLLLVNVVAHTLATGGIAYLLHRSRRSPYAALIYAVFVGNLFALRLTLNEPLCVALAVLAIIAYVHRRHRLTILLLILSTLTKELGLVFAGGIAFHAFFHRRGWSVLIFGAPLLSFFAWWLVMYGWFGTLPTRYPAGKISPVPFSGMFSILDKATLTEPQLLFGLTFYFLGLPAIFFGLAALWTILKKRKVSLSAALVLATVGFVAIMPAVSWHDQVAVYRVGLPLVPAVILFVSEHYPRRMIWVGFWWIPSMLIALMIAPLWVSGTA